VIGQFSSIVDDSMQFYWDMVAKDTIAEGARLHFRRIPAELYCQDCGNRYSPDGETLACPKCQSTRVRVTKGDEFRLDSIDIDSEISPAATEK
jgi:hydrogenase nickel incorporation protein HypA/HybF